MTKGGGGGWFFTREMGLPLKSCECGLSMLFSFFVAASSSFDVDLIAAFATMNA